MLPHLLPLDALASMALVLLLLYVCCCCYVVARVAVLVLLLCSYSCGCACAAAMLVTLPYLLLVPCSSLCCSTLCVVHGPVYLLAATGLLMHVLSYLQLLLCSCSCSCEAHGFAMLLQLQLLLCLCIFLFIYTKCLWLISLGNSCLWKCQWCRLGAAVHYLCYLIQWYIIFLMCFWIQL
jgi:hypothetical protein